MANYGKLFSRIWTDQEFASLDATAQQLYCLLISHSTRDHAGVLPMALRRWARCTAGATVSTVRDSLTVLIGRGFVVADWETEEVLVRTFIRNDEVHKQPQVMRSALKSAEVVESEAIRWALYDELNRLPKHSGDDKTADIANMLVDGLTRRPPEGCAQAAESLPEDCSQAPGVGGYLSTVGEAPTPTPAPTTFTPTTGGVNLVDNEPEPPRAPTRKTGSEIARSRLALIPSSGSQLAGEIVRAYGNHLGTPVDAKTGKEMAVVIDAGLQAGQTPEAIAAGINLWADSDSWSPSQIPKFITKAAAARRNKGIGNPTKQGDTTEQLAAELIAERGQQ